MSSSSVFPIIHNLSFIPGYIVENKRMGRLAPIEESDKLTPETLTYRRLEVSQAPPPEPPSRHGCASSCWHSAP